MSRHLSSASCIILLLLALAPLPYGYYIFLRLWICAWGITAAIRQTHAVWRLLLIGTALLYNPVICITLTRPIWSVLNIITIILIIGITATATKHTSTE